MKGWEYRIAEMGSKWTPLDIDATKPYSVAEFAAEEDYLALGGPYHICVEVRNFAHGIEAKLYDVDCEIQFTAHGRYD